MEEIQVGEYVRTKDGVIAKVTATGYGIDCDRDVFDLKCLQMMEIPPEHVQEYVTKHSFNIIDLLEEGDFVNGTEVGCILKDELGNITDVCYYDEVEGQTYSLGDIKSVVTHEQMEAMEYEIK